MWGWGGSWEEVGYLFVDTKIQKSIATAADILILNCVVTIDLCDAKTQKSKLDRGIGRLMNFGLCELSIFYIFYIYIYI